MCLEHSVRTSGRGRSAVSTSFERNFQLSYIGNNSRNHVVILCGKSQLCCNPDWYWWRATCFWTLVPFFPFMVLFNTGCLQARLRINWLLITLEISTRLSISSDSKFKPCICLVGLLCCKALCLDNISLLRLFHKRSRIRSVFEIIYFAIWCDAFKYKDKAWCLMRRRHQAKHWTMLAISEQDCRECEIIGSSRLCRCLLIRSLAGFARFTYIRVCLSNSSLKQKG